jgi:hypothetical protein
LLSLIATNKPPLKPGSSTAVISEPSELLVENGLNKYISGKIDSRQFQANLYPIWASIAHPDTGIGKQSTGTTNAQMSYLLKNNSPSDVIRLIMGDYEEVKKSENDLKIYEQVFINYLNVLLNKESGVKNKYN